MQLKTQLHRKIDRSGKPSGNSKGVKDHNIVAQDIKVVQRRNSPALSFSSTVSLGYERRLLKCRARPAQNMSSSCLSYM